MANNANYGFEHRYAVEPAGTPFDVAALRFDLTGCTVKASNEILDGGGRSGSRQRREDRSRRSIRRIAGRIPLEPTPANLHFFWKYILGAQASNTFTPAESLPGFDLLDDFYGTGADAIKFGELYVDKAELVFAPGILKMNLDVIGKTDTEGQTFTSAALGAGASHTPYTLDDTSGGFTMKGAAREIERGRLYIDNHLDVKFRNSITATSIRPMDSEVTLATSLPNTSAYLNAFFGNKAAADATIVLTQGTLSCTINLNNLKNPDDSPVGEGKDEVLLELNAAARSDSTDPNISVINIAS